jgi:hypothetical protein
MFAHVWSWVPSTILVTYPSAAMSQLTNHTICPSHVYDYTTGETRIFNRPFWKSTTLPPRYIINTPRQALQRYALPLKPPDVSKVFSDLWVHLNEETFDSSHQPGSTSDSKPARGSFTARMTTAAPAYQRPTPYPRQSHPRPPVRASAASRDQAQDVLSQNFKIPQSQASKPGQGMTSGAQAFWKAYGSVQSVSTQYPHREKMLMSILD